MITCKEDLYGTYVLTNNQEVVDLYVNLINSFGIAKFEAEKDRAESAIEVHESDGAKCGFDASYTDANKDGLDPQSRRLTLADLKPKRTKVEYVKCLVKYAWEAVKEHEENKNIFHCSDSDNLNDEYPICGYDMHIIGECVSDRELYRRIETEIDERQEFIEAYVDTAKVAMPISTTDWAGILYDSGKFKLVEGE